MTQENDQEPVRPEKPVGPTDALERATRAARAGAWDESIAWSLLGLLALERRTGSGRRGN